MPVARGSLPPKSAETYGPAWRATRVLHLEDVDTIVAHGAVCVRVGPVYFRRVALALVRAQPPRTMRVDALSFSLHQVSVPRRVPGVVSLLLLPVLLSACGGDTATTPIVTSVTGTWSLTSVNGSSLPFTYQVSDPKLDLLAKQYVIAEGGTFTYTFTVRATDLDGTVTTATRGDMGTTSLADNVVTFRYQGDGAVNTASVSGATMTIVAGDFSQRFTRK